MRFVGLGGLSLRQQRLLRESESQVQRASLVFLDIITNDLAVESCDPVLFARGICSYAEYHITGFDVKKVVISLIVFRDVPPHESFNNYVVTANEPI